jgi:transposase-like protein
MSYERVEIVGRIERRRRFTAEQKLAVLAKASSRDANISAIARRHGLLASQVYKWRRLAELGVIAIAGASELPSFMAVQVAADAKAPTPSARVCDTAVMTIRPSSTTTLLCAIAGSSSISTRTPAWAG